MENDIESRWWSITVYNEDGYLVENNEKIYALNSEIIDFNVDGGFDIFLTNDNNFISKVAEKIGLGHLVMRVFPSH